MLTFLLENNMGLKIGVTGGIGSGKSLVTRLFQLLNIPTYDADIAAKAIMVDEQAVRDQLVSCFGPEVYLSDGALNRSWLSRKVFNDDRELEKLNAIVHPAVIQKGELWTAAQRSIYSVKEAALLFESGSYRSLDYTILVSSPLELRVKRVMERDHVSEKEVMARVKKQMAEDEKLELADFVIYNDEQHSLISQVNQLHEHFINERLEG